MEKITKNPMPKKERSRIERWARYGAIAGVLIAISGYVGLRGESTFDLSNSTMIARTIGGFFGSVIGGGIAFAIWAVIVNCLEFLKNKIVSLLKR
jgi:hypothetical protein